MQAQSFVLMWPSHVCVVAETLLNINYHALQGFHLMRSAREGLLSRQFAATRLTAFHMGFGAMVEARLKVPRVSNVGRPESTGKKGLS
jgi:hypothetical protein